MIQRVTWTELLNLADPSDHRAIMGFIGATGTDHILVCEPAAPMKHKVERCFIPVGRNHQVANLGLAGREELYDPSGTRVYPKYYHQFEAGRKSRDYGD